MFGLYELRPPRKLAHVLHMISQRQRGGTYLGVLIMGILASLLVSPCVSAPLVGALAYISQTGNVVLGGLALFCLGLGMGLPLLLIGASGGKLLPKSGQWMQSVKIFFGFLLLAVAIDLLDRILPAFATMLLWSLLTLIFWCVDYHYPTNPFAF